MKVLNRFFKILKEIFYPNTCLGCGEVINEGEFLCDYCYSAIESIRSDKQCFKCGHLKSECECKYNTFPYSGCVAAFHNEGVAQKAMYVYKLGRRPYISDFFAFKMANAIKTAFYDAELHGICYVPVTKKAFRKRGFDQSRLLAEKISKILGVPLIENQIGCNNKKAGQHEVSGKDRFKNIKGVFYSKKKCIGNILLIDDIKTTGATLAECSKQLLSSGADSVYCATGLITRKKGKKIKRS